MGGKPNDFYYTVIIHFSECIKEHNDIKSLTDI